MSDFSRRAFLRTTTAGAAALMANNVPGVVAARKNIPIGVQLYSVRNYIPNDVPGTLAAIKKMGYDGVEFAGYYGKDARTLRQWLDDNGLKCCGSHVGLQTVTGDQLSATIEFNQALGNEFLIVPSARGVSTIDAWIKLAETLSGIAGRLKPLGMYVGFHNHSVEFQPIDGQLPMDVLFGKAAREVVMQLDVGHCVQAGADPAVYLNRYPGRALTVHLKEWSSTKKDAVVGEGDVKWPPVFEACEAVGGTRWYILEEETGAFSGLDGIEKSIQSLKKLLA
jgi:sugar phosphate isomerase/epimerase